MSLLSNSKFTDTFKVVRYCEGTYRHGEYIPGECEEISMHGSSQPFRNLELLQEQFGRKVRKALKIYTKDRLFTSKLSPNEKADRVIVGGETYEIHESLEYTQIKPHFKSIAVLMDSQELEGQDAE